MANNPLAAFANGLARSMVRSTTAVRGGFPEGWDRDETKEGMFVTHRCTRCNDGAKSCANGQTGPHRNCEHPHARND